MKRIIILLCLVVTFVFAPKASAEINPFSAGSIIASVYSGLPTQFKGMRIPPIGITVEYGISDFGHGEYGTIGAGVAYEACKNRWSYEGENYNILSMQLSPHACYRYFFNESMEVHAKAGFGWNNYESPEVKDRRLNRVAMYEFVGASYFFTQSIAATAELGWSGVALMHLGVTFAF